MGYKVVAMKDSNTFGLLFVDQHGKIQRWDHGGGWRAMSTAPSQVIDVASGQGTWCLDAKGDIYAYDSASNKWTKDVIAKNVVSIFADDAFGFWCINTDGELFRKEKPTDNWTRFDPQPGEASSPPSMPKPTGNWTYTVKKGDGLYQILRNAGVAEDQLQKVTGKVVGLNPGLDVNNLAVGQTLNMPPIT